MGSTRARPDVVEHTRTAHFPFLISGRQKKITGNERPKKKEKKRFATRTQFLHRLIDDDTNFAIVQQSSMPSKRNLAEKPHEIKKKTTENLIE